MGTETKRQCFEYFGTFSRAFFSMFELTFANWAPIGRFLMEDVSEFLWAVPLCWKYFSLSQLSVVQGCFIKDTFSRCDKLSNQDRWGLVFLLTWATSHQI